MLKHATLVLAACLVGCGDSGTGPDSRLIPEGMYEYSFTGTYGNRPYRFEGTFTLTSVTADEVVGVWNVQTLAGTNAPGFESQIDLGFWNVDAYVLRARYSAGSESGHINHRIAMVGGQPTCVRAAWNLFFGGVPGSITPHGVSCTISHSG